MIVRIPWKGARGGLIKKFLLWLREPTFENEEVPQIHKEEIFIKFQGGLDTFSHYSHRIDRVLHETW